MDDIYYRLPPPGLRPYYHRLPSPLSSVGRPPQPLPPQSLPHIPHDLFYFHHPNPNFDPYRFALASSPLPSHDDVRTLFVAGLPDDVKPREIYNLFREFPGYQSSNLRTTGTRDSQVHYFFLLFVNLSSVLVAKLSVSNELLPFAFVVFADQQLAVAAMHKINGMVFDPEKGSILYVDLAKSNSRSKRSRIADDDGPDSHKRVKGSSSMPRASIDPGIGSPHIPGMSNSAHNMIGHTTALRSNNDTGALKSAPLNTQPCPTLFVANLGPRCKEKELIQLFSRCRGFIKLKVQSKYGTSVAFVDFEDTNCSTEALNQLQGAILCSSAGDGMRLEYAKARMGMGKKPKLLHLYPCISALGFISVKRNQNTMVSFGMVALVNVRELWEIIINSGFFA
ncbi:hypothetical protein V2J09_016296 [Rumex salicifolius]